MILGMSVLSQTLPSMPLKVEAGGIKKDQGQLREQVPAPVKEVLLHLLLNLPQPAHGPVLVVQLHLFSPRDMHIPPPASCRPVRARLKEEVQNRQVAHPLHGELKTPPTEQLH